MLVRWPLLVLAAMLLPAVSGLAQDGVLRLQIVPLTEQEAEKPAPQLVRLDNSLAKVQEDKRQGRIDEKRYQELLTRFRADLEAAMTSVKPTPPNTALRARILSRLGDSERALAALGPALEQDPANPVLRVALGQVRYDQKDYPAALAEANAVLARDPANKAALALKYSSEGRGAATEQFRSPLAKDSPEVQVSGPNDHERWQRVQKTIGYIDSAKAALLAGRGDEALEWANKAVQADPTPTAMKFAEEVRKIVDEGKVDEVPYNPKTPAPKDGGMPLWPMLPISGLGAAAYVVAKSRKTVESEDGFDEENRPLYGRLQRFVAGAILAGLAGAGLYLGGAMVVSAGAPFAARFMSGPGQQAMRLAQSEIGAINPGQVKAVNEVPKMLARVIPPANEVPKILARVIPLRDGQGTPPMLGRAGDPHVFVTAAEDIAGIAPGRIAARLGITPAPRYLIVKFPTPNIGIRTPTQFDNPLFLGRGVTSGGAREFQIMNMRIPENAVKEIVEVSAMSRQP